MKDAADCRENPSRHVSAEGAKNGHCSAAVHTEKSFSLPGLMADRQLASGARGNGDRKRNGNFGTIVREAQTYLTLKASAGPEKRAYAPIEIM